MIQHRTVKFIVFITFIIGMMVVMMSPQRGSTIEQTKHELAIEVTAAGTPGMPFDWRFTSKPNEAAGKMDLYAAFLADFPRHFNVVFNFFSL